MTELKLSQIFQFLKTLVKCLRKATACWLQEALQVQWGIDKIIFWNVSKYDRMVCTKLYFHWKLFSLQYSHHWQVEVIASGLLQCTFFLSFWLVTNIHEKWMPVLLTMCVCSSYHNFATPVSFLSEMKESWKKIWLQKRPIAFFKKRSNKKIFATIASL